MTGQQANRPTGQQRLPRIAITVGDPAGIGPEIVAKAAADPSVRAVCQPVVFDTPSGENVRVGETSAAAGRAAYDTIVGKRPPRRAGPPTTPSCAPSMPRSAATSTQSRPRR
jgi:hypothetical protein